MGLKDMFNSVGIGINDFVSKEQSLSITNKQINLFHNQIAQELAKHDVSDCEITIVDGQIKVTGNFAKGGGGSFEADIIPHDVVWNDEKHALLFNIVQQDIKMNKKIMNAMTGLTTKVCGGLFGVDYLNKKVGVVNAEGKIEIPLDGQSKSLDAVIRSVQLNKLDCIEDRLSVTFTAKPKEALKNGKQLMEWWATVKASNKNPEV